jgi:PTS system ascorbate-specific IIA component
MPGLVIIAHAPLASSLKSVAEHAFPDCASRLVAFDVPPDMPAEEVEAHGRRILDALPGRAAIIFTDVFGATPCNVAQRLADGVHVKVVTGVNVPMLWRSLCYAGDTLDAGVARAVAGATQGVMQVATTRPQAQPARTRQHAPGDDQDQ